MKRLQTCGFSEFDSQVRAGMPGYVRPLSESIESGDGRLSSIGFDPSDASFRLWGFLRSEEARLSEAVKRGKKLVGTMKDLGTVPVLAYSLPDLTAFYPDGAWWLPCMNVGAKALKAASALGIGENICPVRAMIGAFEMRENFPLPDRLICSVGATCDDFSALAQFLAGRGHDIVWWEIPHRRQPGANEEVVRLSGGTYAPVSQVAFVREELRRVVRVLEDLAGMPLSGEMMRTGIRKTNAVRKVLGKIRETVFCAGSQPVGSVELLIAEMLAIHFCSDPDESMEVLAGLLGQVEQRVAAGEGFSAEDAVKVFWVNPPADFGVMNILDKLNCRLCGTDFMFQHALDQIAEEEDPLTALAMCALADPMAGSIADRADRIRREAGRFGAEAIVVSRIPGASHCAFEGRIIADTLTEHLDIPVLQLEIQSSGCSMDQVVGGRMEALCETVRSLRR